MINTIHLQTMDKYNRHKHVKTNQKKAMNPQEIENLKETHEKIRAILIEYGNKEFGDCIIDEICVATRILPTSVYYNEII